MQNANLYQTTYRYLFAVLYSLFLVSCALKTTPYTPSGQSIESFGFNAIQVHPILKAYLRIRSSNDHEITAKDLTIYIEGDGANWLFKSIPPSNPTPHQSLVAAIAAADQSQYVMYIARPCQFIDLSILKECDAVMWTDGRFSAHVIQIFNQAIDRALFQIPSLKINLVGQSGGGTLAILVASQRSDVSCLVTLASPLDISAWTRALSIAPLLKSMNPAVPNMSLKQINQTHFLGKNDIIVPLDSIGQYRNFPENTEFITISGFDHRRYWVDQWPLLQKKSCLRDRIN